MNNSSKSRHFVKKVQSPRNGNHKILYQICFIRKKPVKIDRKFFFPGKANKRKEQ
jgi:hypothetical protein